MRVIKTRATNARLIWELEQSSLEAGNSSSRSKTLHPLMARLFSSRAVTCGEELNPDLKHLLPPESLYGMSSASALLLDAINQDKKICIVADYD